MTEAFAQAAFAGQSMKLAYPAAFGHFDQERMKRATRHGRKAEHVPRR